MYLSIFSVPRRSTVNGHAPVSHKVKHQDELRGITAKLIKIEKLEVGARDFQGFQSRHACRCAVRFVFGPSLGVSSCSEHTIMFFSYDKLWMHRQACQIKFVVGTLRWGGDETSWPGNFHLAILFATTDEATCQSPSWPRNLHLAILFATMRCCSARGCRAVSNVRPSFASDSGHLSLACRVLVHETLGVGACWRLANVMSQARF